MILAPRSPVPNILPEGHAWNQCDTQRARSHCAAAVVLDLDLPLPAEDSRHTRRADELSDQEGLEVKGSQKPKKLGKKPAQKTLKERRTAKRAAAKQASRGLDV